MPIMDGRGHVLCGGGGLQGSLDGTPLPFATYGGGCWYDDRGTALEQLREGATDPVSGKPVPRLAFCREGAGPVMLDRAANDFAGGGGAFVAWLAGYGVWGTLEQRLAGTAEEVRAHLGPAGTAGPRAVAPDGTIAYVPDRQNGYGLALVGPDGRAVVIPGIPPVDVQVLGAGVAIWRGGAEGRAPTRPSLADAQSVQLQTFAGAEWLLYWSELRGCVLQRDGDPLGCVLDSRPLEFNAHMRVVGAELWICWSTTQGEGPSDLVVLAMAENTAIRYLRTAAGVEPQPPRWLNLAAPITPPIERPPVEPPRPIDPPDPIRPPIEPPIEPPITPPTEPPPITPGVNLMVYIDLLTDTLAAESCEEIDNGNGTYSYRKQNGKIFCLTPDGTAEERDTPGGPWESFKKAGNALVAERDWDEKHVTYLRPYAEIR